MEFLILWFIVGFATIALDSFYSVKILLKDLSINASSVEYDKIISDQVVPEAFIVGTVLGGVTALVIGSMWLYSIINPKVKKLFPEKGYWKNKASQKLKDYHTKQDRKTYPEKYL